MKENRYLKTGQLTHVDEEGYWVVEPGGNYPQRGWASTLEPGKGHYYE